MSDDMPRDLKNWEILRRKGRPRFILITGILSYGIPMFAIMTFFVNRKADEPVAMVKIVISAIVWTLGGAIFGWVMWHMNENRYQKFLAKSKTE